ncbi:beta-ketoacyl-ACP synthase [Rhodopila sp.]|uniref:beta-ketoacyl-ACP synthase n=1 Tax=Rhodopila sp. TaxID=2480087 RepID=UPI003D144574
MTIDTDHLGRRIVVVTGMGVLTSLGQGQPANWQALTAGVSGIRRISRFPIDGLRTTIAGTVDFVPVVDQSAPALSERMAELVIEEAIAQARIGRFGDFPGPLFLALPPVELEWPQRLAMAAASRAAQKLEAGQKLGGGKESDADQTVTYDDLLRAAGSGAFEPYYRRFLFGSVGENLAERFGTKGSPVSTSTACASGGTAIQLGVEAIRRGEAECALVAGTDASVNPESLIRFSLLSALSIRNDPPSSASRPFSKDREGFVMAEGAGALVLESLAAAQARGATVLGVIEGCGEVADGFHRTRSSPDGKPIIACMRNALADAGLDPAAIDYINAHGTGTPENDKMEWVGITAVFGDRAGSIPISSNKSMIGHSLTAAGAIEAIFTLLTIRAGLLPPTINYDLPDPALPVDCVPNVARPATVRHAISNSFGFGGQNVCLVIGAPT